MVVLGLGSNLGDRLTHLRRAFSFLKKTSGISIRSVSPIYSSDALLPDNAPDEWNHSFFNLAILCETTFSPQELLSILKSIEKKLGRSFEKKWSPRVIDIDILAWDNLVLDENNLQIPHRCLHERPFALWPLADLAPEWIYPAPGILQGKTAAEIVRALGSRFTGDAPFHTKQIAHRIDTPILMGVLNITSDSFSSDGIINESHAVEHAKNLILSGAEMIDIGAESTNPNSQKISAEEEWRRLFPVLSLLKNSCDEFFISPKISIDTYHAETAKKALDFKVDCINDVSGLDDPLMRDVIKNSDCDVVVMHHLGIPARAGKSFPSTENVCARVHEWATQKLNLLEKENIPREKIIFDVGIGFGKEPEQSFSLIKNINYFRDLNVRLLAAHSRKRFLTLFTNNPAHERDVETVILSLSLAKHVDYLRVHDIDMHARAFKTERGQV